MSPALEREAIRLGILPAEASPYLFSFDYHRAMKILNGQTTRDWELESAARYVRKTTLHRLPDATDAEANLRDVLNRRFGGVQ